MDPLDANDMLKSATIYRNGEFNYIFVCYHCGSSFTNSLDTLNHVESHFDSKVEAKINIANANLEYNGLETQFEPNQTQLFDTDNKGACIVFTEKDNRHSINDTANEPTDFEHVIVEQKFHHSKHNEDKIYISKGYKCRQCDQRFTTAPLLILHMMKIHTNTVSLTCPKCSQDCRNDAECLGHLQEHLNADDTTYDELIDLIEMNYVVAVGVNKHKDMWRNSRKVVWRTCDICSSTFPTREKIIIHMKEQHMSVKKDLYDCAKCDRKIDGKFGFYAHQYGHITNDEQLHAEDDLPLKRKLKNYLKDNIYCDEKTQTYGCLLCNQITVKAEYGAKRHIMQTHIYLITSKKTNSKLFPCEYCGKECQSMFSLKVHKRIHTMEKPFTCTVCNKSFSQKSYMKYHEKIHTGQAPFQCSICGRTFRTNNKLNFHLKCHQNLKIKCPICDKELKTHRLKFHIRTVHENEHRPFKCEICSQAFKTLKTLRQHAYRHSEKQFECRHHCKEKFTTSSSRRAHERSKHESGVSRV